MSNRANLAIFSHLQPKLKCYRSKLGLYIGFLAKGSRKDIGRSGEGSIGILLQLKPVLGSWETPVLCQNGKERILVPEMLGFRWNGSPERPLT